MEGSQLHNLHDNQSTTNAINGKQNSEDLTSLYQNVLPIAIDQDLKICN